ncbi:MAG TPA: penicillin-binding transpeptidase domain-containing protein, partial [Candidatus Limnocylindria bacterium]|nr:penicillin-binding transpeptidase domain-containing protein [Candidatus Limnocylindria bacterium]
KQLAAMLTEVTGEGGTGVMAKIEGFEVAGKTGTAQKVDLVHGGYSAKKRVASFIGFVPAHDPRLVALVLIDEPELNVYGGVVAAPVFRNIAQGALRRLAVASQKTEAVPAATSQAPGESPLRGAVKRVPDEATAGAAGQVPDFVGLSMREALEKAQSIKVKIKLHGNGYVVRQAPAAGGRWNDDGILLLNLQG